MSRWLDAIGFPKKSNFITIETLSAAQARKEQSQQQRQSWQPN
jgi:hypothetical protein